MAHMFRQTPARLVTRPALTRRRPTNALALLLSAALGVPALAQAQASGAPAGSQDDSIRFRMPTVTVTALKEPVDKQKVPVSVTAVSKDTIDAAAIRIVSEAAIFAPNTYFTEWSARKLSNARFRGISSSPNNPGITTYIDGVPQLSANSSSIELLDVDQIEFVRGPQSALFGRNTLGGLVNITSSRPSVSGWTGAFSVPFGNHGAWGVRGGVGGPIVDNKLSVGVSVAQVDRDGFTVNDVTGNDIDSRSAFSGKAQLLWLPNRAWETRVIFTGEQARDGDYSLNDVGALRSNPFHAARDFEGFAEPRRLWHHGAGEGRRQRPELHQHHGHRRLDDAGRHRPRLHTTAADQARQYRERAAVHAGVAARIRRRCGHLVDATPRDCAGRPACSSSRRPTSRMPSTAIRRRLVAPIPVSQHSPRSALDDFGIGLFGQATLTFNETVRSRCRRTVRLRG